MWEVPEKWTGNRHFIFSPPLVFHDSQLSRALHKMPHSPRLACKALVMQATDVYWPVMQLAYHSPFMP